MQKLANIEIQIKNHKNTATLAELRTSLKHFLIILIREKTPTQKHDNHELIYYLRNLKIKSTPKHKKVKQKTC